MHKTQQNKNVETFVPQTAAPAWLMAFVVLFFYLLFKEDFAE